MQFKQHIKSKLPFFVALSALFVLASCGSYQYVGYDNDGIYGSERQPVQVVEVQEVETTPSDANYFKNYFSEKSQEYEAIANESEIFTDIDSYEGNREQEQDSTNYGGWGDSYNSPPEINVYYGAGNIGLRPGWVGSWAWHNWRFGNFGWGDPFWNNWGWGFGINNGWGWGWNAGFGIGWGWNVGFGWGWNNWGWGWNNFWCPPFWGNNFYGNSLAFNYGRRGAGIYNNGFSRLGRTSTALNRRDLARRSIASNNSSQLRRNTGRTLSRNSGRNVTRNSGRNVTRNSGRNVTRNTGRNVSRNSGRNVTRNTSRTRTRVNTSRPRTVSPSRSSGVRSSMGRSSGMSRSTGGSRSSGGSRGGRR